MIFYFKKMDCFIRTSNAVVIAEIEKRGNARLIQSTADVTDKPVIFKKTRADLNLIGVEFGEPKAERTVKEAA